MTDLADTSPGLGARPALTPDFSMQLKLPALLIVGFGIVVVTSLSTEPFLAAASLVVLLLGGRILWRTGEPPILFALFCIQWLQATTAVFRASAEGVALRDLYGSPGMVDATWFCLGGLLALACGIRFALRGVGRADWSTMVEEVRQYDSTKVFVAYCLAQVAVLGLQTIIWYQNPGLFQALLALSNLRGLFFFLLIVTVLVHRRGYIFLIAACSFEFTRGFLSFYSDYKYVFLIVTLAYFTARPQLNVKKVVAVAALVVAFGILGSAWSIVKGEYRSYLNFGTGGQFVGDIPVLEQVDRIADLMINRGFANLGSGFEALLRRVEYTYYFGRTVERVPSVIPHEDGKLWGAAITHVLTPRLLFPNKPSLAADYQNTEYYTGLIIILPGTSATEVPIGYMTESYIDFGPIGMLAPIFMLGLVYGSQYRFVITRKKYLAFAYGAIPIILSPALAFELTSAKILGGTITIFIAFLGLYYLLIPIVHRVALSGNRPAVGSRFVRQQPMSRSP